MRVLTALLFLIYFSSTASAQQPRNIIWFTEKSPTATYGFDEGQDAPNLSMKDIHKRRFDLYKELDKLTIIDFRKTDCESCTKNNRYLKNFYKKYSINIISIYDDNRSVTVKDFARANGMDWTNVQDDAPPKELLSKQLSLPDEASYIILSPDHKVLKVIKSGNTGGKLGAFLQQHFADK